MWLDHEVEAIKQRVEQECGVLIYQDAASFGQAGSLHRTSARKGKGTRVKSFPDRKGAKVMGAIRVDEKPGWHFRFVERYNTDTFTKFVEQSLRYYKGRKILLVVITHPGTRRKRSESR